MSRVLGQEVAGTESPKRNTQSLAAPALASHARARASLTIFSVWLLETVRTGENGLKRATYAFQSLLADPCGVFPGRVRGPSPRHHLTAAAP
jgi:hypothetical protein